MALTKNGYTVKRLTELKQEYDRLLINRFGPINTEPDSVIGQLEGIWADALAGLYEQAQDTYHAMYPFSAEGTSLDGAVSYVGLTRIAAAATEVAAVVYGRESSLLKSGAQVTDGRKVYKSLTDVIISRANTVDALLEIHLQDNASYSLNVNGQLFSYVSGQQASASEIITGLGEQLDPGLVTFSDLNGQMKITAADGIKSFALSVAENLKFIRIGSPVRFIAEETGRNILPVGALNQIVTPVSGWDAVDNLVAGSPGRRRETDEELRVRFEQSRHVVGSATVKAIRARLMQEAGVTNVQVFENRTNRVSEDGVSPHGFEALVAGGDEQKVADAIWAYKPAGIETCGSTEVTVRDENGDSQLIRFSRPATKDIWLRIKVTGLYQEEDLSADIINSIQKAVLDFGNRLGVGDDVILQRFIGPVFQNTTGLGSVTIEAAVTQDEQQLPDYQQQNIEINKRTIALFDRSRIEVTGL